MLLGHATFLWRASWQLPGSQRIFLRFSNAQTKLKSEKGNLQVKIWTSCWSTGSWDGADILFYPLIPWRGNPDRDNAITEEVSKFNDKCDCPQKTSRFTPAQQKVQIAIIKHQTKTLVGSNKVRKPSARGVGEQGKTSTRKWDLRRGIPRVPLQGDHHPREVTSCDERND